MSTNSIAVAMTFCGLTRSDSTFNRGSGTEITPTFGSIVQNGKFAASALLFERALNKVDLPTFGNPTIPHCTPIDLEIKAANILGRPENKKASVNKGLVMIGSPD
jgi:hypothetical protein